MVIFIADLPKPVHGMSNVNHAFVKLMSSLDSTLAIKVINTAPSLVSRFYPGKIWKLIKLFWMIVSIVRMAIFLSLNTRKVTCLIRPINAGFGQLYDILITIVAKIFCVKIYFHHHSFKYLNKKSKLSWVLFKVAGESTIHIALGQKMKVKLKETYSLNSIIEVLSNAFMFDPIKSYSGIHKSKDGPFVLGHLANVCVEKGVFEFLDTLKILNELGFNVIGKLAGPIHDLNLAKKIISLDAECAYFSYIGPVYGKAKNEFYQDLDVFIFPSKYLNEAEPLVLFEAAQCGVFSIGSDVGCMSDILNALGGVSVCVNILTAQEIANCVVHAIENDLLDYRGQQDRSKRFDAFIKEGKTSFIRLNKSFSI